MAIALPSAQLLATLAGILAMLAGVALLRRQWARKSAGGRSFVALGWLLVLVGFALFVRAWEMELGIAYGLVAFSLVAYLVVATGAQVRSARQRGPRDVPLEPQDRRTNWARGTAKAFLAIVLSGVAAIGLGIAFALGTPFETHDRIVLGGLLVPVLWGAGMAWTLCDAKLLRATGLLLAVSAFGYGVAFLPKLLP
ncbi:MAG: conserved rane protein of unknown function [Xanthobacteraceae bacterium]|nr:conserved rane protein of unknown function [Xanthobacteraceae bacterium]